MNTKRIREAIGRALQAVGVVTAMLGAASMDSADMRYPVAIMAAGAIVLAIGMRIAPIGPEESYDWDEE